MDLFINRFLIRIIFLTAFFCSSYSYSYIIDSQDDLKPFIQVRSFAYGGITESDAKKLLDKYALYYQVLAKYKMIPTMDELRAEFSRIKKRSKRKGHIKFLEEKVKDEKLILLYFVFPILSERKLQVFFKHNDKLQYQGYLNHRQELEDVLNHKKLFRPLITRPEFNFKKIIYDARNRKSFLKIGERAPEKLEVLRGETIPVWREQIINKHILKPGLVLPGFITEARYQILKVDYIDSKGKRFVFSSLEVRKDSFQEWLNRERDLIKASK